MSRIFIERPIFAWVLAIIVMLCGVGALTSLPIEQYPDIAPAQVNVRASYPGASAETVENSVTQVLEQQLTGIDGLLYFSSNSNSRGGASISVTFSKGTDPDIAQVQVQNRIQQALPRLPQDVQRQGVQVTKSNPDTLLMVGVFDTTNTRSHQDVADYLVSNIQDTLSRVDGVGDVNVFGSQHAMRIWLDPHKLAAFSLVPADVITAINNQNTEVAAGEIGGQPSSSEQLLNATVTSQARLQTADQFRNILLKTQSDGSVVRVKDIARVEVGAQSYNNIMQMNRHPSAGMAISLTPGADALRTAEAVKVKMEELSGNLPEGLDYAYANDSTAFIRLSVKQVVSALLEAVVLVVIVMFVFLQSWRATLIPAIAVPVVLLGTFAVLYFAGFSVNTLTLFGLVIAIGLLVDDAIVVVENVERLMHENPGMTAREATIKSMAELQVALIAIGLVLSAVFLPMAFFGGSTGVIYRQFSLTIITAMILSVLVALILSPALTAALLKPPHHGEVHHRTWFGTKLQQAKDGFNSGFDKVTDRYVRSVTTVVDRKWLFLIIYVLALVLLVGLFVRIPGGFIPGEDQGRVMVQYRLPAGATEARTLEVRDAISKYLTETEAKNADSIFLVAGGGTGQNSGQGFVNLKHWDDRKGPENTAAAIADRTSTALRGLRDAQVFALVPGAVRGLGDTTGFSLQFLNSTGMSQAEFAAARDKLIELASNDPMLSNVRPNEMPDQPTLRIDTDFERLTAYGLSISDVNSTLSTAWGGRYIGDYIENGRIKRVFVQGDAPYRSRPEDLGQWFVRTSSGQMAPFSSFAKTSWQTGPTALSRFQGLPAYQINGQPAAGVSSGEAMDRIEELTRQVEGTSAAWSGASFEERLSSGQAPVLYGLSLLVVFLCLAALYESWSIPFAVLLVIPLGLVGAVFAVTLRGLQNDIYLQIGLLTTMGLAAKNAILMIEFAEQAEKRGARVIDAALEAARIRLRPILMTSFAFIFGVLPLAIASGAGANSQIAIGTSVIGGMLTATLLAIFYIPLFFVLVRRGVRDGLAAAKRKLHLDEKDEPAPEVTA